MFTPDIGHSMGEFFWQWTGRCLVPYVALFSHSFLLTCLFNSLRLSWMLRIDWNTGLSNTEMRALRSAPTCLLFLRSSVWRTLVWTSFRSSRAARVSLEIGILISMRILPKPKRARSCSLGAQLEQIDALDAVSLLFCSRAFLFTVHHYYYFTVDCFRQVDSAFGNSKQQPLPLRICSISHSIVCY